MRKPIILICLLGLLIPVAAAAGEENFIGGLRNLSGSVRVMRGAQEMMVENGFRVHLNDTLITGKDGAVGVVFKDNTRISLGPDSKLTITQFVYSPAKKEYGLVTKMIKGTASYISGAIGKASPDQVKFKTPVATIGVRGTTFVAKVAPQ